VTPGATAPPDDMATSGARALTADAGVRAISREMRRSEPVFIVGVPRSGTTPLRRTLDRHPAFRARWPESRETRVFDEPERILQLREPGSRTAFHYMLHDPHEADALETHLRALRTGLLRRALRAGLVPGRGERARILRFRLERWHEVLRLYFFHSRRARGCRRILEKTPIHVLRLPEIFATFPRARVLICLRHPVDVYSSFRKRLERDRAAGVEPEKLRWLERDAETFATRYRKIAEIALERAGARDGRCRLVRYEALSAEPRRTLDGICRFVGEAWDEALVGGEAERDEHGSPRREGALALNRKRWEDFLPAAEARELEKLLAEPMARLGYERLTGAGLSS